MFSKSIELASAVDELIFNTLDEFRKNHAEINKCPAIPSSIEQIVSVGELIDKLAIVNIKLYDVKSRQSESENPEFLAKLVKQDISLCKERSQLKNAISRKVLTMLNSGDIVEEVKTY